MPPSTSLAEPRSTPIASVCESDSEVPALPAPRTPAAVDLLTHARSGLCEAARMPHATDRYATAHLSALRIAAAALAVRTHPADRRRGRPLSAWVLLQSVAPELTEWAAFFAAGAEKRSAAEAGLSMRVSCRDADDLIRQTWTFYDVVAGLLGIGAPSSRLVS